MEHDHSDTSRARPGDWLEVEGTGGYPSQRGRIVEIIDRPGHARFRVRWDEEHESIVYPTEHGAIVHPASRGSAAV